MNADMATNWTPNETLLQSVVEVLQDSFAPDSEIQRRVQEKLSVIQNHPDFVNYLLCILKNSNLYDQNVRSLSVIILKNNITTTFESLPPPLLDLIKQECLNLLTDLSGEVRKTITTLIGVLVWKGTIASWPNLIPYLCNLVDSQNVELSETALLALFKICEEYLSKRGTEMEESNEALNELVGKFITLVTNDRTVVRQNAIKILNQAMHDCNGLNNIQFDAKLYMNNLFQIIKDEDTEVQKLICQAFCIFIDTQNCAILARMHSAIEFVLQMTEHEDSEVALQACEFWLAIARLSTCKEILGNYIERLLPMLFKLMRYSVEELEALKNYIGVDEHLEDKPDDIKPFNSRNSAVALVDDEDLDYCNGDGDYDNSAEVGESYIGWTLRKCSAASIDALSLKFRCDMLPIFFPLLNQALNNNDCLIKESAILALGAIAEGCLQGLQEYLPRLIPYLLECMNSDQSLVRVITCWTISRYMAWMMENQQACDTFFVPVMTLLLKHFLDCNKRVQRAALSAFCIFQEEARQKLVPYIDFILHAFLQCFNKLKFRSNFLLYDAIGVLSQSVGGNLSKPEFIEMLLPPLMNKFNSIEDYYDQQFIALMECLSAVVHSTGVGFLPYAEVVYNRCLLIINETLTSIQCNIENPYDYEAPDRDPMCFAHDLLLCMALGLKTCFVKFVTNSNLLQSLYYTMQDELVQVRQPALALYGELVKLCYSHLNPTVINCIPIIIENIDPRHEVACNNAVWAVSRLCIAMGNKMEPFSVQIVARALEIMPRLNPTRAMYQTLAICVCTLGLVCPDAVLPHLSSLLAPCCQAIRNVGDCEEKEIGFRGLCNLVLRNPMAAMENFVYFCDAVASWNELPNDLKEEIKNIMLGFKSQLGENHWKQFPIALRQRLHTLYCV